MTIHPPKNRPTQLAVGILLPLFIISCFVTAGLSVWNTYKNDIISQQKEQLLIIVSSLAENLEENIADRAMSLEQLIDDLTYTESLVDYNQRQEIYDTLFSNYLNHYSEDMRAISLFTPSGETLWSNDSMTYTNIYDINILDDGVELLQCMTDQGDVTFLFQKTLSDGRSLSISMDVTAYYDRLISDIRVGTSGYAVVKSSDGILFMHPEPLQRGLHVIYGRDSLYEGVDLTSLTELVGLQNANESGIYEYDSYWWLDDSLRSVRKIAAHAQASFGDDFMVVSVVTEYDDIYSPILASFTNVALMFAGILLVVLLCFTYFYHLAQQNQKNKQEIAYLRDLNQVLEETKRTEATIAHQQRLQIMGTMTGGIAHEFNNMLTPIMGYAELLQMDMDPDSDEFDSAQEILNAAERAKEVIQQIAVLSKKNMETVLRYIPLQSMLKRTMKMLRPMCTGNISLTLKNIVTEDLGFLGNETQFSQVMLNLTSNAIHAIGKRPNGAISIHCQLVPAAALSTHQLPISDVWQHYIELQLTDNGSGIEATMVEQIFNPFFTTKVQGEGVGLGLSLVEQIVLSSQWQIAVESQVGRGTTFFLYLPVMEQDTAPTSEPPLNHPLSILLLDDNERILRLLEGELSRLGLSVSTTNTVEEGRALLTQQEYHALFISQHLSRTSGDNQGIHFAISLQEQYPNLLKFIMADQIRKELIEAKQSGYIQGYVEKPVSHIALVEALRQSDSAI